MMITLQLRPEIETEIRAKAKLQNLSLEKYLEILIEREIGLQSVNLSVKKSGNYYHNSESIDDLNEWKNLLLTFINSPLDPDISPLSDEGISRENIYTREDEIL